MLPKLSICIMFLFKGSLTLESVRTETKPHEDMNPPAFLKRWYSSLAKRYILNILD
jgi:hypothetical protein